jgi:hypothetical protein
MCSWRKRCLLNSPMRKDCHTSITHVFTHVAFAKEPGAKMCQPAEFLPQLFRRSSGDNAFYISNLQNKCSHARLIHGTNSHSQMHLGNRLNCRPETSSCKGNYCQFIQFNKNFKVDATSRYQIICHCLSRSNPSPDPNSTPSKIFRTRDSSFLTSFVLNSNNL